MVDEMSQTMDIVFDISEDEIPIFLAEVDEHLQVLDDGLIRLENESTDPELVQTVFRSAHTIKGMAGMIGHRRMTDITHALETALDGVRKKSLQISTPLINTCLDAVDRLRLLREEVVTLQTCEIDVDELVLSLKDLTQASLTTPSVAGAKEAQIEVDKKSPVVSQSPDVAAIVEAAIVKEPSLDDQKQTKHPIKAGLEPALARTVQIYATIPADSVASAARAFQLMMALQELGEIQSMQPSQAQIETASAVSEFSAILSTTQTVEKINASLNRISGLGEVSIDGGLIISNGIAVNENSAVAAEAAAPLTASRQQPGAGLEPATPGMVNGKGKPQGSNRQAVVDPHRRGNDMTVRTNVERLDNLMNLVGELITDRNHLQQIRTRLEADVKGNGKIELLSDSVTHLGRITDQIQEEVMRIRMLPIGNIFNKFPRMVRDMAQKVGKHIDVVIRGEETEMDRSMIEVINDPLIHLVRNSVDHGIETPQERITAGKPERGTITLTARHEQGRIILTVEDDGGGINGKNLKTIAVQKGLISADEAAGLTEQQSIDLMFMAGLSTARQVTDISGRGVGLDIVYTNIQKVNGSIEVETRLGFGTQFQIVLPLTLAIIPSLLVGANNSTFAIPLVMITETLRLDKSQIKFVYRKPVTLLRGNVLSLFRLSDIFQFKELEVIQKYTYAVVIQSGKQKIGLIVDSLVGEEEVVVKSLGAFIGDIPGISSAAILGDGEIALIVDVFGLFKLAGI